MLDGSDIGFMRSAAPSCLALDDELGEFAQGVGFAAKTRQGEQALGKQFVGGGACTLQPEQADIGGFARHCIFATGLAQCGGAAFHVQDVVNHLKGQAEVFAKYFKRSLFRL